MSLVLINVFSYWFVLESYCFVRQFCKAYYTMNVNSTNNNNNTCPYIYDAKLH